MIMKLSVPAGRKNIRRRRVYIPEMRENEEGKVRRDLCINKVNAELVDSRRNTKYNIIPTICS